MRVKEKKTKILIIIFPKQIYMYWKKKFNSLYITFKTKINLTDTNNNLIKFYCQIYF